MINILGDIYKKGYFQSPFMEEYEIVKYLRAVPLKKENLKYVIDFGFSEGERGIFYVQGAKDFAYESEIVLIRGEFVKYCENNTHQKILGSLMGHSINRDFIGDINIGDGFFVVAVKKSLEEYLLNNFTKVGKEPIRTTLEFNTEVIKSEKKEQVITVSSLRLDNLVCAITNKSRNDTKKYMNLEMVKLNHTIEKRLEKRVNPGDVLSLRKFGRFQVKEILNTTKKGKIRVLLDCK